MIIAIVRFKLPNGTSLATATETVFTPSVPKYRNFPGLLRKNYLFGHGDGGGVYLWESREAAEEMYTQEWREFMIERFGNEPEVTYFESPVEVDNSVSKHIS